MQTRALLNLARVLLANRGAAPHTVVGVVAVRHDGTEPVVAAAQLQHDQDAVAAGSFGGEDVRGQAEEVGGRRGQAEPGQSPGEEGAAVDELAVFHHGASLT